MVAAWLFKNKQKPQTTALKISCIAFISKRLRMLVFKFLFYSMAT